MHHSVILTRTHRARARCAILALILVGGTLVVARAAHDASAQTTSPFVTRNGTALTLDNAPFRFTGVNVYNANSRGWCGADLVQGDGLAQQLSAIRTSTGGRARVVRSWFYQSMATTNGARDWSAFDNTIAAARAQGMLVIPTLGDQWGSCDNGGQKSEAWFRTGYRNVQSGDLTSYRTWVSEVVARYRNEPTVAMWMLLNEPETSTGTACSSTASASLRAFTDDVGGLVQSTDTNHLVALGSIGTGQCGMSWVEYKDVSASSAIDVCDFHDFGQPTDPTPGDQWNGLELRAQQCRELGKPLVVSESGIDPSAVGGTTARAQRFDAKIAAAQSLGVAGYVAWNWDPPGSRPGATLAIGPGDPTLPVLSKYGSAPAATPTPTTPTTAVPTTTTAVPIETTTTTTPPPTTTTVVPSTSFVTRSGSQLLLDGRPFRFSGSNLYWLALDDNYPDGARYPTKFRIEDGLTAAQDMGATVVRAWADTVGCTRCIQPTRGSFNNDAFQSLDHAVNEARRRGIRLILPLLDNWSYAYGGKLDYTGWRGRTEPQFFTDPTILNDYKAFITKVLTHVNPVTGLAYKDDPTIMAWETGNEMWCQKCAGNTWNANWTRAVADHIKAIAPRQLVVDGHAVDPNCTINCLDAASLQIPSIDIVDDHFYPLNAARIADASNAAARAGKAYLAGEFDWVNHRGGDSLDTFLRAVENNPVAGALSWALIPHDDHGGFALHSDGYELNYPGANPDQIQRTQAIRAHAYRMRGLPLPAHVVPPNPVVLAATRSGSSALVSWRGSAGALTYTVQRARQGSAEWSTVASGLNATTSSWRDPSTSTGARYRVQAVNLDGAVSGWSGPTTLA